MRLRQGLKRILTAGIVSIFLLMPTRSAMAVEAKRIDTDTTNFNGKLSPADTNVQACLEKLDDVTESDPQVGSLVNTKWCTTDGSVVNCVTDAPVLSEADPKVATLTSGNFCKGTGTQVSCTDSSTYLTAEVDGSTTNEIEVVDEAYSAANFNGGTTSAVSQDDFYDYSHIADPDDDGKISVLDLTAGMVQTNASGVVSATTMDASGDCAASAVCMGGHTHSSYLTSVTESNLSLSDVTTANASATKHGLLPKWPNNTTTFFRGDGTYATPTAGAGGSTTQMQYNLAGALTGSGLNVYDEDDRGTERVSNGTFTGSSTGWGLQAPAWTYGSDKITKNAGSSGYCQHNSPSFNVPVAGQKYEVVYTVSGFAAGSIYMNIGGATLTTRTANGTYTEIFTASSNQGISFQTTSATELSVDNVSVKRITGTQTIQGALSAEQYVLGNTNVAATSLTPIAGTVFSGTGSRTWIAFAPGSGNQYTDFQLIQKGSLATGNYDEWRVGYDSANNVHTFMTAGHGTTAGIPMILHALAGQSTGGETLNQIKLLTDGKVLMSQTTSDGNETLQVGGSVSAKSTIGCTGTIGDDCEALSLTQCVMVAGCSLGSYACEGTHSACSTYTDGTACTTHECTINTACTGTHSDCVTYDQYTCASHGCTEDWYDPFNCSCGNQYCENGACSDEPSCTGDPCYSTWHPDTMNCTCGPQWTGCSGYPHTCQQSECDASTDGCANTFASCSDPGPHTCQESECTANSDGCAWVPYSCDGDPSDTDCDQITNAECLDVTDCYYDDLSPAYTLKNDTTGLVQTIANDANNVVYDADTGIHYFLQDVSATDFINRTSVYDKSKGSALDKIKDSGSLKKDGKIDHKAMYGYKVMQIEDRTRPVMVKKCIQESTKNKMSECVKYADVATYPYKKDVEGVSMSDQLALFQQAIFELRKKADDQKSEIEELKKVKK